MTRGEKALSAPLDPSRRARLAIGGLSVAAVIGIGWLIVDSSETTKPLPSSKGRLTTIATKPGETLARGTRRARRSSGERRRRRLVQGRVAPRADFGRIRPGRPLPLHRDPGRAGLVGGLLLLAFLVTALAAVGTRRVRGADPLRTAAAACLIAFLVHVALDWTWEFPAVTLIPLLLVAGVMASPAGGGTGRSRGRPATEPAGERPLDGSAGTRPRPDPVPG